MQEEVESRTVNLAISTSKLSARTIVSAVKAYLNHRKNVKVKKEHEAEIPTHGKQTVKELIGQGQGVTNIDIAKTDLKGFEKVARKYGIDYAIRRDSSVDPPHYLVFLPSMSIPREFSGERNVRVSLNSFARSRLLSWHCPAESSTVTGKGSRRDEH